MKKLKSVIQYECMTSFKYIWIFYAIQYAVVGLITVIIGLSMGTFENVGTNFLEMNTLFFVGFLGVLSFTEDFKMLLQNGFTRKYIFIATFSLFGFISGIMALVDTTVGNLLHHFNSDYSSLYSRIYGYDNLFMNWLLLFLIYMLICCLFYLGILVINKVGKTVSIYLGVILGGCALLTIALFRYVFSSKIVSDVFRFVNKAMGFMANGTINYFFPALTLFTFVSILGIVSFVIIRCTELK